MTKLEIGILAAILASAIGIPATAQSQYEPAKPAEIEASADVDWDNKIVAIRRLTIMVDEIDGEGDWTKRGIPHVEIELEAEVLTPAGALNWIFRIGPWDFVEGGKGCGIKSGCKMIVMTPEEFDALKDGDLISMHYGVREERKNLIRPPAGDLREAFLGTRFGKLDKSLIDRCEPVVRSVVDH